MLARLQYLRFCLFEIYVNVVFVIRRLYSAVSLTLAKEQSFMRDLGKSIDYLLIFVSERTSGDWCAHVTLCVCVCVTWLLFDR